MGGGLLQLVAYGAQDVYLSGQPQITFFKIVFKRHTNFAVEPIDVTFSGSFDFGRTLHAQMSRNGDLLSKIYLRVTAKLTPVKGRKAAVVRRLGHAMIDNFEIQIGGQKVD